MEDEDKAFETWLNETYPGRFCYHHLTAASHMLIGWRAATEASLPKWNKVEEVLPPDNTWVLVYADGAMNCMCWNKGKWMKLVCDEESFLHNINPQEITHWMCLPEPPGIIKNERKKKLREQWEELEALREFAKRVLSFPDLPHYFEISLIALAIELKLIDRYGKLISRD